MCDYVAPFPSMPLETHSHSVGVFLGGAFKSKKIFNWDFKMNIAPAITLYQNQLVFPMQISRFQCVLYRNAKVQK